MYCLSVYNESLKRWIPYHYFRDSNQFETLVKSFGLSFDFFKISYFDSWTSEGLPF